MRRIASKPESAKNKDNVDISEQISGIMAEEEPYNTFYDSVSVIFRLLSFLLFACLLLFIISSAFVSAESFSYRNLDYIMRNFSLTLEENRDSARQPIRYNPDASRSYSLFGRGLAICGSSGVYAFSATGRQTCSEFIDYMDPVMVSSGKYILVYDSDGLRYSLYNAFSNVLESANSKPIRGAAVAENGCFLLITSSDEYTSVVEVYNSDFNLMNRFNKNGYVVTADITDDKILIVTVVSADTEADLGLEITISDFGESPNAEFIEVSSGFPLGCHITDYGYSVVCNDSALFFNKEGAMISNYEFDDMSLYDFKISKTHALLIFKGNGFDISYKAVCLDQNGNAVYEHEFKETIYDIDIFDDTAYFLTEKSIVCTGFSSVYKIDAEYANYECKILALDRDSVYYCTDTFAELLTFSD